jgi:hypothetical protein
LILATDDKLGDARLDEEVEGEEEQAEEQEAGGPEELKAMKLEDGMKEARGDNHKAGFAAARVERSRGNIAGEAAAEGGEAIIDPQREFCAIAPKRKRTESKRDVTEARQKTESGTGTPIHCKPHRG